MMDGRSDGLRHSSLVWKIISICKKCYRYLYNLVFIYDTHILVLPFVLENLHSVLI